MLRIPEQCPESLPRTIELSEEGKSPSRLLAGASARELADAARKTRTVARRAAGNFFYAFALLPDEQRRGIEALYAFCRTGDDITDDAESPEGKIDHLNRLRQRLDLCYQHRYCDEVTLALAWAIHRFNLNRQHFDDLLAGLEADLTVARYPTFQELRLYCYQVAATVGLLCIQIFGGDTPEGRRYAEHLGIGMQLTNILRDLYEDYGRGRIYLPQSDLLRFGIPAEQLFDREYHSQLRELVLWEAVRAEGYFAAAEVELPAGLRGTLFAAIIMGETYRRLLARIKNARRYDRRISLPAREKIALAAEIAAEAISH